VRELGGIAVLYDLRVAGRIRASHGHNVVFGGGTDMKGETGAAKQRVVKSSSRDTMSDAVADRKIKSRIKGARHAR